MKRLGSLFAILVAVAVPAIAGAGLPSGKASPVEITSDPVRLKPNEEGTLRVRIATLAPVDRLEVSVSASTGVVLPEDVPPAIRSGLKHGDRHELLVPVRLTAPAFGHVIVNARITSARGSELHTQTLIVGTIPPPPPRVPVGTAEELSGLTLLRIAPGNAIVRFGQKELLIVRVGDRLGRNGAEIVEIAAGRMVLDETFVGSDGRPNRARVTLKEGETGGTRVLLRNEEEPPQTGRQRLIVPSRRGPGR